MLQKNAYIYELYAKLPQFLKSIVSRIWYRPVFGKGVHLYGWPVFSENVKIGDYSYLNQNHTSFQLFRAGFQ